MTAEMNIVGRERELSAVSTFLDTVAGGRGGVLVIEADAGVGKSAIVSHAGSQARLRGLGVLTAVGAAMESQLSWGVVRQLFGRRLRSRLDDISEPATARVADEAPPFATFDTLYWLLVELADSGPLLVVVDDVQWLDEPSHRWLDYVSRRIDDLPVGMLLAGRPQRQPVVTPSTRGRSMPLLPLDRAAVERWLHEELGVAPATGFVDEFRRLTGGNALLVSELLRAVRIDAVPSDSTGAARLAAIAPRGIESAVAHRLAGLGEHEKMVVTALAVLESGSVETVARVAGLPAGAADQALTALRAQALVTQDAATPRFVHPLIHAAVERQLPRPDRESAHTAAARVLHASRAAPEQVSAHLVRTEGLLEPWATAALLAAAARAETSESPAAASSYLRRAVAAGVDDVGTRLRLARASARVEPQSGLAPLQALLDDASGPDERALIAVELSRVQRECGDVAAAVQVLLGARDELDPHSALRGRVEAELLACSASSRSARLDLASWRHELLQGPPSSTTHRDRAITATRALDLALDGGPRTQIMHEVAVALDGVGASPPPLAGVILSLAGLAQLLVDEVDAAQSIFDSLVEGTRAPAAAGQHAGMLAQRASLSVRRGQLADALADARTAVSLAEATRTMHSLLPRAASTIITVAAHQGTRPPLKWITEDLDPDNISNRLVIYARAELLFAQQNYAAAAGAYERYGAVNLELGWSGVASPWRSQLAICLVELEQPARAAAVHDEELQIALVTGVPSAIGVARHAGVVLARSRGATPEAVLRQLREADEHLRGSPLRIEHGWLLADLGETLLATGAVDDARDVLYEGRAIAAQCDATRLRHRLDTMLGGTGARPAAQSRSLTRSESTVAQHAAAGMTNRQIARTLFVTEKTVEAHLRATFRKLGVRSRADLAERLQ